MLAHWDPFTEISRLQDGFFGRAALDREGGFKPSVDIYEDDDGIHVKADLAGVKPEDIKVSVENNVLTISGERKLEKSDKKDGYHRIERFHGGFNRSFALTDEVVTENIDAQYANGVLTLTLARRPETKPREIAVRTS